MRARVEKRSVLGWNKSKYDNNLPLKYLILISEVEVRYVQDIIVARKPENLRISGKELKQVI